MQISLPTRRPLDDEGFQVVIIGGGINGVAIARECALRGKRTLLLEQHDFGSGTTSRSTRIIHGGLRYLEHGELGLVREAARERRRLLQDKPHLVRPVEFLLALDEHSRRSALAVRAGLWLYRHLGGPGVGIAPSRARQKTLERLLDSGRRWSIFSFEDAQCEFPERLVSEWLTEAMEAGATTRNHAEVLSVEISRGHVKGVLLRDRFTRQEERVSAEWIINAAGPWADELCRRSQIRTSRPMIGGIRGSHIVVSRFPGAPEAAVYTEAIDGRPIFVVPWNNQLLVGTTEVPDRNDPAQVSPSKEEIEYLLRSLRQLFPAVSCQQDVHYAFAGIRPLPFSDKQKISAISRRHFLHDHTEEGAAGMISVIGGKLSTAAQLARECGARLGIRSARENATSSVSTEDLDAVVHRAVRQISEIGSLSEASARAVLEWHGRRATIIARMARSSPQMSAKLCSHSDHIVAEAVDAFGNESATTLADVLLRRVPIAFNACWSQECAQEAGSRIAAVFGWDQYRLGRELEAFETERAGFLRKPVSDSPLQTNAEPHPAAPVPK